MERALERQVRARARGLCQYCRPPQSALMPTFPIDHVIARQHGGPTAAENLTLCCGRCNLAKGPNIAGLDPDTGRLTRLFNPRTDIWSEHFRYDGAVVGGLTDVGRTAVVVLAMNQIAQIDLRLMLIDEGIFPPR